MNHRLRTSEEYSIIKEVGRLFSEIFMNVNKGESAYFNENKLYVTMKP